MFVTLAEVQVKPVSGWETHYYAKWRDTVAGWMASPRQGMRYDGLHSGFSSAITP